MLLILLELDLLKSQKGCQGWSWDVDAGMNFRTGIAVKTRVEPGPVASPEVAALVRSYTGELSTGRFFITRYWGWPIATAPFRGNMGREVDLSFWVERHGLGTLGELSVEVVWPLPTADRKVPKGMWCISGGKASVIASPDDGVQGYWYLCLDPLLRVLQIQCQFCSARGFGTLLVELWTGIQMSGLCCASCQSEVKKVSCQSEVKKVIILTQNKSLSPMTLWLGLGTMEKSSTCQ